MKKLIPYGKSFIDKDDINSVVKSLKNQFITSGPYVKKLESSVKEKFKVKYSLSCSSGTAALHLSFLSLELKKDDIVILPIVNFIAASNVISFINAKVYFADVDMFTGQMTPKTLENCIKKNNIKKIKAFVTMYLGGSPDNVYEFFKIKKKYNCYMIEDACHALGAFYNYKNKKTYIGSCRHSDICTFSLHPLKSITSGEGGLITTNNNKLYQKIKTLRSHGFKKKLNHWDFKLDYPGFNYRLSDINSALACSQLKKLKLFVKKRTLIANKYIDYFKNSKIFNVRNANKSIYSSWHLFILNINFKYLRTNKNKFLKYLLKKNIIGQQHYIPIYNFKFYKKIKKKNFPNSKIYHENSVSLPIYYELTDRQIKYIFEKIRNFVQDHCKKKND